jgi:hypothetical protein
VLQEATRAQLRSAPQADRAREDEVKMLKGAEEEEEEAVIVEDLL